MSDNEEAVTMSDGDDEIEVTAKEVYDKLTEAWLNEKFAPELLESQAELVECMLAQVREIESNFTKKDKDLVSSLQKIELERVKFLISSYLRERIRKIEEYNVYVLQEEAKPGSTKMSPNELKFAKTFSDNLEKHLSSLALNQMPCNMQTLKQEKNPRPNMDTYILMKANQKVENILLDPEDEPTDLEEGSQHILRYQPIAALVESSAVSLV